MNPLRAELPRVHLSAAELCLARTPTVIETVLGSCVAAAFWSPKLGIGAMCHGALPRFPAPQNGRSALAYGPRYVDFAIRYLFDRFLQLGAKPSELVVKLFGGADMLKVLTSRSVATIGAQNRAAALGVLQELGITPGSSDMGGTQGRVIYFRTDTGEVLLRRLSGSGGADDDRLSEHQF